MAYIRKRGAKWYYTIARPASVRKSLAALHAKKPRQPMLVLLSRGYVEPTKKTVAEFFAERLSDDVGINTHQNTVRSYRPIFENHIRPSIGDRKLHSIRPQMFQHLLNDVKNICHTKQGRMLTPDAMRAISINGVAKPSARATPFIPCATRTPPFCLRRARTWNLFPSV